VVRSKNREGEKVEELHSYIQKTTNSYKLHFLNENLHVAYS